MSAIYSCFTGCFGSKDKRSESTPLLDRDTRSRLPSFSDGPLPGLFDNQTLSHYNENFDELIRTLALYDFTLIIQDTSIVSPQGTATPIVRVNPLRYHETRSLNGNRTHCFITDHSTRDRNELWADGTVRISKDLSQSAHGLANRVKISYQLTFPARIESEESMQNSSKPASFAFQSKDSLKFSENYSAATIKFRAPHTPHITCTLEHLPPPPAPLKHLKRLQMGRSYSGPPHFDINAAEEERRRQLARTSSDKDAGS